MANNEIFQAYVNEFVTKELELIDDSILVVLTPSEIQILIQGMGNRKKILRGKIRNNETHQKKGDVPSWSDKDFETAIKKRKIQLAESDMLKTRLENL